MQRLSDDVVLVDSLKDLRKVFFVLKIFAKDGIKDAVVVKLFVDILHSCLATTNDVHHFATVIEQDLHAFPDRSVLVYLGRLGIFLLED